ncbi:hypothetical protein [Brachybacterium endophyticum]|nr:hypothetical protein [Brachybacterium endophyticum]
MMTVLAAGVPLGGAVLADPSDGDMTSTSVTPGNGAFIVMFLLAVAVVLLAVDMTRRVRRIQAKGRAEEHLAQEETPEEDGGETADGPSSAGSDTGERNDATAGDASSDDTGDAQAPSDRAEGSSSADPSGERDPRGES